MCPYDTDAPTFPTHKIKKKKFEGLTDGQRQISYSGGMFVLLCVQSQ